MTRRTSANNSHEAAKGWVLFFSVSVSVIWVSGTRVAESTGDISGLEIPSPVSSTANKSMERTASK